jgi:hypothetical protein
MLYQEIVLEEPPKSSLRDRVKFYKRLELTSRTCLELQTNGSFYLRTLAVENAHCLFDPFSTKREGKPLLLCPRKKVFPTFALK